MGGTQEPWPVESGYFDVVVSNQVGEHVSDLAAFFAENSRVLREGGVGIHLFPLRSYVLEGHLMLPLAHRVRDHDLLTWFIGRATQLRLGKFARDRPRGEALRELSERHADYLHYFTRYRSWREVVDAAQDAGLRATYRHTSDLYLRKWETFRRRARPRPAARRSPVTEAAAFHLLRHVSSVTVMLEKRQSYVKKARADSHCLT